MFGANASDDNREVMRFSHFNFASHPLYSVDWLTGVGGGRKPWDHL